MRKAFVDCSVVEADALPERVNREDFLFTEGPVNDRQGGILFCDYKREWIVRYDERTGECAVWAEQTGGSNGACFFADGTLASCRGNACDVVTWTDDGRVRKVLASEYEGRAFNGPNDLVISGAGWVYFTDPNFDQRNHQPESVYSISPVGDVSRLATGISRPNGIVLTPDESTLIVNGTLQRELVAFDVRADGGVENRRVYAEVRDPNREAYTGYPPEGWFGCDGMAMDVKSHLFVTCGAGVEVFDASGQSVGVIVPPEKPTNVCFGGEDRRTLYITAQKSLYAVRCLHEGLIFQQRD